MSVAKHTPAPWEFRQPCCHAVVAGEKLIASYDPIDQDDYDQGAIDFTLIAAAPELLAALKAVQPLLDIAMNYDGDVFGVHHNDAVDAVHTIAEVIAKATGGAA